jgi:sulfide:quinone oxidoreductase
MPAGSYRHRMASDGGRSDRQKVLIAGAGVAGIEAALALHELAGDLVTVELRDPRQEFVMQPFAVGEPYGGARVFRYETERLAARCGASFRPDGIIAIDPVRRLARTREGDVCRYDHFVAANGVRMLWAMPGAITFWGTADEGQVGDVIESLGRGGMRRLVFTMPAGHSWVRPLYELALLGAREVAKSASGRTRIAVVTPEAYPLEAYGRAAGVRMGRSLEERGIEVITGASPLMFERGRLVVASGEEVEADAAVSLPRLEGRRIAGLLHDDDGFLAVDEQGRVPGLERVYAAGDITTFPVKQSGLATRQADLAARSIAADAGAAVDPQQLPAGGHLTALIETLANEPQHQMVTSRADVAAASPQS